MKRIIFVALGLFAMIPSSALHSQEKRGTLYGWVVVVDPGHGGSDPGASAIHNGARVNEDEYVYDVALRVQRIVRQRQGLALLTLKDNHGVRNLPASQIFPNGGTERFAIDGSPAQAGKEGLQKRVDFGNRVSLKYPKHRQAWISIHFDVVGRNSAIQGVRIIAADDSSGLVKSLSESFGAAGRLRDDHPVVESGDDEFGIRNLFVLRSQNRIKDRVLIELGNFLNDGDLWRIRDPQVRERYAEAIAKALEQYERPKKKH